MYMHASTTLPLTTTSSHLSLLTHHHHTSPHTTTLIWTTTQRVQMLDKANLLLTKKIIKLVVRQQRTLTQNSPNLSSPKFPHPIFFPTLKLGPTINTPALLDCEPPPPRELEARGLCPPMPVAPPERWVSRGVAIAVNSSRNFTLHRDSPQMHSTV